jgi:hypothetical protein
VKNDSNAPQSAIIGASRLGDQQASIIVSEFTLNHRQRFRAEIIMRDGKPVVSISRWKKNNRTGQAFEFGAHRTAAVTNLLMEVQRVLDVLNIEEGSA